MATAPMSRVIPTQAQAERISRLFNEALVKHPRHAEVLRGVERVLVQQPVDSGPGLPEPLEALVLQIITAVAAQGPFGRRRLSRSLREP